MRVKSGDTVATLHLNHIEAGFGRAEARFEGLRPPAHTFDVRVFVDEPHADGSTRTDENPHYLGTQHFYGLGPAGGGPSQSAPTMVPLNVTQRLQSYIAKAQPHAAPITLVAVDRKGNEIAEPDLVIDGFSLVTR